MELQFGCCVRNWATQGGLIELRALCKGGSLVKVKNKILKLLVKCNLIFF